MLSKADRKEAIRNFKELKPARGVFAVRCTISGSVWVGDSVNLGTIQNRIWAGLRMGKHLEKTLQEEWNAHGEPAFEYQILEKLDDDVLPMEIADLLKAKKKHWMAQLGARPATF